MPEPASPTTPAAASPTETLSADQLRARLDARRRDIEAHLDGLKHEFTSASSLRADFEDAARPALDEVREHPERSLVAATAGGFVVGALWGLSAWLKRRRAAKSAVGQSRMLLASLLGGASGALAKGKKPDATMKAFAKEHGPLIVYAGAPTPTKGTLGETFDLAVKTALGFGVKTGMDLLTKKLTGKPEVFQAAADAAENPPPERPYG